ncbi:MAG: hypothetical protein ABI947_23475 [Chloroflexota bacterium]
MNVSHPSLSRLASAVLLILVFLTGLILWKPQPTIAQDAATPTPVPLSCNQLLPLARTNLTRCNGVSRDQVCYANNSIAVEYADPANSTDNMPFSKLGDIVPVSALKSITTSPLDLVKGEWGLAVLKVPANVAGTTAGQTVTFVLYGDTSMTNLLESQTNGDTEPAAAATCSATTTRSTFLRAQPDLVGEKGPLLPPNSVVDVTGRLANNTWVQGNVKGQTGWLFVQNNVNVSCDLESLPAVEPVTTASGAFPSSLPGSGAFYFSTGIGAQAACNDIPSGGLLIQSEGGKAVTLRVNGADMTIGSTVLLRAEPNRAMTISVLEGQAVVIADEEKVTANSGQELSIPLGNSADVTNGLEAVGPPSPVRPIQPGVFSDVCALAQATGLTAPCIPPTPIPVFIPPTQLPPIIPGS